MVSTPRRAERELLAKVLWAERVREQLVERIAVQLLDCEVLVEAHFDDRHLQRTGELADALSTAADQLESATSTPKVWFE
jgi:hypothetical protein